jgi:hypothetical protein
MVPHAGAFDGTPVANAQQTQCFRRICRQTRATAIGWMMRVAARVVIDRVAGNLCVDLVPRAAHRKRLVRTEARRDVVLPAAQGRRNNREHSRGEGPVPLVGIDENVDD